MPNIIYVSDHLNYSYTCEDYSEVFHYHGVVSLLDFLSELSGSGAESLRLLPPAPPPCLGLLQLPVQPCQLGLVALLRGSGRGDPE